MREHPTSFRKMAHGQVIEGYITKGVMHARMRPQGEAQTPFMRVVERHHHIWMSG